MYYQRILSCSNYIVAIFTAWAAIPGLNVKPDRCRCGQLCSRWESGSAGV